MSESKRLIAVDLQYMFHRHKYRIESYEAEHNGAAMLSFGEVETARLYFTMKDLFAILSLAKQAEADVVICMDSKSDRKEENSDYKANRVGLKDRDIEALNNIEYVIRHSGLPVMKEDGYEADDLVASIVRNRADEYDNIIIYTPDADLSVLISDKVSLCRYKSVYSKKATFLNAHKLITRENMSETFSEELKTDLPFNAMILYKCTVGDPSDGIKGIQGFGPAAFRKMIANMRSCGINFETLANTANVAGLIESRRPIMGDSATDQALAALELVRSRTCASIESAANSLELKVPDLDKFMETCSEFGIKSL